MTDYAFEGPKRSSPSVTWSFASQNFAVDAAAPFSSFISPLYQATIQSAFNRWSSVSGLSFTQVADSAAAAIRIGFGVFASPYAVGETIVRSINGVLPNDTVVRLLDPARAALNAATGVWTYTGIDVTLYQVALHEIGHALGLDHTTGAFDGANIMYPVATSLNRDLSAGDIEGINTLYPLYTVSISDPVQVEGGGATTYHYVITRHNDLSQASSVNYQIVGAAYPGLSGSSAAPASAFAGGTLPAGQLTFAADVASVTLSIVVTGDATPQTDRGFALSLSSADPGTTATVRGSVNAVILDQNSANAVTAATLSIYRFFDTADGTHFITASASERNTVLQTRPDLVYEGVGFGALADLGDDPTAISVYRFFDTVHGTHFYTASASERDTVLGTRSDLHYEGVAFYEHGTQRSGDTAVYRFFDTQSGTHFLTSAASERANILATRPAFIDEGVAFYAPTSA